MARFSIGFYVGIIALVILALLALLHVLHFSFAFGVG